MNKFLTILAGVACIGIAVSCAQSDVIPQYGLNSVKLLEVSSMWRDGAPLQAGAGPAIGDELRAVMSVTGIHSPATAMLPYWRGNPNEEMTGLIYDLTLTSVGGSGLDSNGRPQAGTVLYYSPLGRNPLSNTNDKHGFAPGVGDIGGYNGISGGVVEMYDDASPDLGTLMATNPSSWVTGSGGTRDSFPNGSDGNLWLSGVFLELRNMGDANAPRGAVYKLQFANTVEGSGLGFINVFDGSAAPSIDPSIFGQFVDASFAATIVLNPTGTQGWQQVVNDPIQFDVSREGSTPEPATMLLLGTGASLLGFLRRKRS